MPTVDTLVAQHLLKTVTAIRLMGADCIISGIRPQIAQTIVHLGVDLQGVTTKATLADALALALKRTGQTVAQGRTLSMERIPILRMGEFLLVTIQVDMHDQLALTLQDDLTDADRSTRRSGVLIDISALDMVDSFIGRMIANISGMARILGRDRRCVVGMQPAVAITLVELGLTLQRRAHRAQRRARHGAAASAPTTRTRTMTRSPQAETLPLRVEQDIVLARQAVRKLAAGAAASRWSTRPRW